MAYDLAFAQSVLLGVCVRLVKAAGDPRRTKERDRWARANIPLPAREPGAPGEYQPHGAVLWSVRALESPNPVHRFSAVRVLAGVEWAAPEACMAEAAGQLMANLGAGAVPVLAAELASEDETNRRIAMYGLAYLGTASAGHVQTIAAVLHRFPKEAAVPLVTMGEVATPWILEGLRQGHGIRDAILDALEDPRVLWPPQVSRPVLDALMDILSDPDPAVRGKAVEALESAGCAGPAVLAHYEARAGSLPETGRQLLAGVIAPPGGGATDPAAPPPLPRRPSDR